MGVIKTPSTSTTSLVSRSVEDTLKIGQILAGQFKEGMIVALFGNIGSGKTTLVRGMCKGLGIKEHITSPTYKIMNNYQGKFSIYHFDFYRLNSNSNFTELGLDEFLYGAGVSIIEWPDRIIELLHDQTVRIHMEWKEDFLLTERNIEIISDQIVDFELKIFFRSDKKQVSS